MGVQAGIRRVLVVAVQGVLVAALIAVASAVVLAQDDPSPRLQLTADGAFSQSNSRDGRAIFTVAGIVPGEVTSGTVTIGNTGTLNGVLELSGSQPVDSGGVGGAALSEALELAVSDQTGGDDGPVYVATLDGMTARDLGTLRPGEERTYRFTVHLPDRGAPEQNWSGDNVYQRASTTVDYTWTLTQTETQTDTDTDTVPATPSPPTDPDPVPPDPVRCGYLIEGTPSRDLLTGAETSERLVGDDGPDLLEGLAGDDCLRGGRGADRLLGGSGDDRLAGGPGPDVLRPGSGRDVASGGDGDDLIRAKGGGEDVIRCGRGYDIVSLDRDDRTRACEDVLGHPLWFEGP